MLIYSQTSTDPFVLEANGSSPTGIAKLIAIFGLVPLVLGVYFMFAGDGEGEAAGLGLGLAVLGGATALVGLFRLGAEHAARFLVVTQPRRLALVETDSRVRVEADRHLIPGTQVVRIEIQRMVVPPAFAHQEPEDRFIVAIVTRRRLIELQLSSRSDAEHYAKVLSHRLDAPISARQRPLLPQAIGLGGAYLILALFGMMGLAFWSLMDSGNPLIGIASLVGLVALQYPIVRLTMVSTVRRWMRLTYGIVT